MTPPTLRFSKMHGTGNDFMVIDAMSQRVALTPQQIQHWADRHVGVGFDQLLLVEPPTSPEAHFRYRVFNPNGDEVEQCGNGARCIARFVHDKALCTRSNMTAQTNTTTIGLALEENGQVCVAMGQPCFDPPSIPLHASDERLTYPFDIENFHFDISVLSLGNPHASIVLDELNTDCVAHFSPLIERHPCFPKGVNVGWMQIRDKNTIRLRVYERSAGPTLSCGSGACAAVIAGVRRGLLNPEVCVQMPGGDLRVRWQGMGQVVFITGPVQHVFDAEIPLSCERAMHATR